MAPQTFCSSPWNKSTSKHKPQVAMLSKLDWVIPSSKFTRKMIRERPRTTDVGVVELTSQKCGDQQKVPRCLYRRWKDWGVESIHRYIYICICGGRRWWWWMWEHAFIIFPLSYLLGFCLVHKPSLSATSWYLNLFAWTLAMIRQLSSCSHAIHQRKNTYRRLKTGRIWIREIELLLEILLAINLSLFFSFNDHVFESLYHRVWRLKIIILEESAEVHRHNVQILKSPYPNHQANHIQPRNAAP